MTGEDVNLDQQVKGSGQAIQAGRDVVVHASMSVEQMSEIMVALARQLASFVDEAKAEQQRRFDELRNDIVKEFAEPDSKAHSEAFKDPDFQYVVREAHDAYARSGDEQVKDELVRLISERSRKEPATRIARVLNDAIQMAGKLSAQEYATLVVLFVIQKVVVQAAPPDVIVRGLRGLLEPFIDDLPPDDSPIEYLQSLGCVTMNSLVSMSLADALTSRYAHAFGPGFTQLALTEAIGTEVSLRTIETRVYRSHPALNSLRFRTSDEQDLRKELQDLGVPEAPLNRLMELRNSTLASQEEVLSQFERGFPFMAQLRSFYSAPGVQQAIITIIGRALAHSALVGRAGLSAPIEIWVK